MLHIAQKDNHNSAQLLVFFISVGFDDIVSIAPSSSQLRSLTSTPLIRYLAFAPFYSDQDGAFTICDCFPPSSVHLFPPHLRMTARRDQTAVHCRLVGMSVSLGLRWVGDK